MEYSISVYFLYFIIIAICGWFMEITLQLFEKHKFADRGFLIGPYCPIYGVGGLLITLCLTELKEHPIALFCVAIVICAVLEYLTSYVMEKLFHARWWDYSNTKYNINGRICLETIIPFGILGVVLIYIVNPFIFNNLMKINPTTLNIIAIIVASVFVIDIGISLKVVLNVRSTTKKFDKENPKDSTEEISLKVREFLRGKSILNRRLINAFPKLTAILKEHGEKIKQKTAEVKEELTNKAMEMKEDLNEKASEVKADLTEKGEKVKKEFKQSIDKTSKTVRVNMKIAKRKVMPKNKNKGRKNNNGLNK